MEHQLLATAVQLLRTYKSTPASSAACAVDKAMRSAADPDLLLTVDSAVGGIFYSTVYEPLYFRIWSAVLFTWRDNRLPNGAHRQTASRIANAGHNEIAAPQISESSKSTAPAERREPQPWGSTIALLILGSLFVLAFAQSYSPAEKVAANSPPPVASATPDPLRNVPETDNLIEYAGRYWQWDGKEWKPVPRAIPADRTL
jgi:hypothetical protein